MGVYIKSMEMPETCIECMNSGLRTAIRCTEWTKISAGLRENHRALSCHLTEVPEPHGRLIDEDNVIDAVHERLQTLQTHKEFIKKRGDIDLLGVLPYISKIQTVIEAEGSENETLQRL